MKFVTDIWNLLSAAGVVAGIIVFAFGAIKTIIGVMEHQSNSMANNIFLMVSGVAIILIFTILKGVSLNFGDTVGIIMIPYLFF